MVSNMHSIGRLYETFRMVITTVYTQGIIAVKTIRLKVLVLQPIATVEHNVISFHALHFDILLPDSSESSVCVVVVLECT